MEFTLVPYLHSLIPLLKPLLIAFRLSNFANPWVISNGPTQIMYVFAGEYNQTQPLL